MKSLPFAGLLVAAALAAAEPHRVARDVTADPATRPHLRTGATPEGAFGNLVDFAYDGLNPAARYSATLRFSAKADRVVRLMSGSRVLADNVVIMAGRPREVTVALPAATYATGVLTLAIERVSGEPATVAEVEIRSDDPRALTTPHDPATELPRLSPRPVAVAGCAAPALSLDGGWKFCAEAPADLGRVDSRAWQDIRVPGEWVMQGFSVKPGTPAAYQRDFTVPKDWTGKRVKLRLDAVYSEAVVFVNGREAGRHSGGFTPFELDVTDAVRPGARNTLTLSVRNAGEADRLAAGSASAGHPLGGITRSASLFALPAVNLAALRVTTTFDEANRDATLKLDLETASEAPGAPERVSARLKLTAPDGAEVPLPVTRVDLATGRASVAVPVRAPASWDPEHPRLHTLTVTLEADGRELQTVVRKVGFREIRIRGNTLLVNGRPVKLRGVNRHETHPIFGRSVPATVTRGDVALLREANVNHLRTSHYPPDEALLEAADELGMFVEVEAPFCRAPGEGRRTLVCRQTAEMVVAYRDHPSVLMWSLANESEWGPHFAAASEFTRRLDPTRPQTFNGMSATLGSTSATFTAVANLHYPGRTGIPQVQAYDRRPVHFGEECHLNTFNRRELATDPGLRDRWGDQVAAMWDDIVATPGALGQSVWAAVDDTFHLPPGDTVGYGAWGVLDGWRRPKPEYHGLKVAYSPVRLIGAPTPPGDDRTVRFTVENRACFTDLAEMRLTWRTPRAAGVIAAPRAAPGERATPAVTLPDAPRPGERLEVAVTEPRGVTVGRFSLPLAGAPASPPAPPAAATYATSDDAITVRDGAVTWRVDRATGRVTAAGKSVFSGPELMVLPLNADGETRPDAPHRDPEPFTRPCAGWRCTAVSAQGENGVVTVTVAGDYAEARGAHTLTFRNGVLRAAYDFAVTRAVNPRQIGLVFTLPRACEVFSWERVAGLHAHPEDHIARTRGRVRASEGFAATSVGPRTAPSHPWRLDNLPYGNNDFCSTKHAVLTATLTDATGAGLRVIGDGATQVRCWRDDAAAHLLAAGYANGGAEPFLRGLNRRDERPLKAGDRVTGEVTVAPATP